MGPNPDFPRVRTDVAKKAETLRRFFGKEPRQSNARFSIHQLAKAFGVNFQPSTINYSSA